MSSTNEADFVWVKEVKEAFARSFPEDYEQLALERFQQCIEEEMQMSSDQKRLSLLFETLLDFYNHFCWKVKFKKPSEIMKIGLIRLLATLIKVGLMIRYDARLKTILIVLTDEEDLLYSALLLVSRLKKKSQEAYGILLRDVLCTRQLCPSTPETYLKIVLLLRRLQSLTHNKPRHLATPPIYTIQWLEQHCPKALPENPKPHILTNHLLQKKLPSDVLEDLREVLLPFDSKLMGPLEKTLNEEILVSDEDAFTIEFGGLSSHQDKTKPLTETRALKKKKRLSKRERKRRKTEEVIAEGNESGEDEKGNRICQAEKTINKEKSKTHKHLLKIIESKKNDGSNLLNETKKEDFVLADNNVEETKSKKRRRKRKKKNSSTSLDDKTEGITPSVEEIRIEEQNADLCVKGREDLSINTSFERGEESNRSTKKKKRLLGKEDFSNSFVAKESCDSLPLSKKRKISKTEKLSSSKEELNDQSCSLSLSSNFGEDMNESAVKCRVSCDPPFLGSPENMLNSEGLPQKLKTRKNKKMPELEPITVQTVIQSLEEDGAKDECIGTTTTEEKEHNASSRKSKKRKSRKCAGELQTSDLVQCVEKESALDGTLGMDIDSTTEEKDKASPKKSKKRKSRRCANELQTSDLVQPAVDKESALDNTCGIDIKSQFDSVRKEVEEEAIENKEQMLANTRKRKSKKSLVTVEAENKDVENSEKEEIIDDSSDPQLNKSSSKDLEIKESVAESTGKKSNIYNVEKDPSMPCVSSSFENTLELEKKNSTNETTCLEVGNQCPSNKIQEVKEESLTDEVMSETFQESDATNVSSESHSDLLKEENEEKPKCLIENIIPQESLSEDSILLKFAAVKNELQIHHQEIAFAKEEQTNRIRVLPVLVKKNENSDEESEQLAGIRMGEKVPYNGSSVAKEAVSGTSPKSKFPVAESLFKEELNETLIGNNVRSEAGNLSNRISIKSQSSDSEMSSKEAIINEYDERLSENTEIVISVSDESCAESSSLDKSVKKTNKIPFVTSGKQVTKSKRLCNDKLPSIIESPNYDSDASSSSSLKFEGNESSLKCAAFEKENTPKTISNEREINIAVESKSSGTEDEAQESLALIKNVKNVSANNESSEQEVLFTPKKRSGLDIGKHSQKLLGSSSNSIKIQNISNADILTEGDKSSINSTTLSNGNNEVNLNLEAKSCIENKTNNKRLLGAENGTKDCSIVLVDIFESTGELGETMKQELCAREELVQNVLQGRRLGSEKNSDLNSNHSTHKNNEWILSYENDFSDKSDDEKDSKERLTRSKTSRSKDVIKTEKNSSNLRSKKESTNSPDPVQDVVPSGRYNLRRSCKKFPNVKQPHSQRLAPVPRMSFSPLVRKAANFPDFSDVSENLNFDEVEKFNDEYRESPADLTIMVKVEDDVLSNEHELSSLPLEPDSESQPMESTEGAEHLGSENSSDVEFSQGLSENGNDEPSQPLSSESTCDAPAEKIGDSKSSSETIIRISKSRLKVGNSSGRQKPARGYSLRSGGAATDLELNLERLSIGTPTKNANSKENNAKTERPAAPKEIKTVEEQRSLRRSKRNLVLPGKLKL